MILLALDTSTHGGSCALARDRSVLREHAAHASGRPHGARLPGSLIGLLEDAGIGLSEVDVFAVATGPGSFTGLRVGIAAMQGLAFATGRPLIGISALDALAVIGDRHASEQVTPLRSHAHPHHPSGEPIRVATWVDAWRGDVYAALYVGRNEVTPAAVSRPNEVLENLVGTATIFIGNGAETYADLIRATMGEQGKVADCPAPPLAGTIAELATDMARGGDLPPPDAIRPLYVRRPDAELARAEREPLPTRQARPRS